MRGKCALKPAGVQPLLGSGPSVSLDFPELIILNGSQGLATQGTLPNQVRTKLPEWERLKVLERKGLVDGPG